MQINAVNGIAAAAQGRPASAGDGRLNELDKQIEAVQKKLKELARNNELSPEQKTERQKDLNEQLADLRTQRAERQRQLQEEAQDKAAGERRPNAPANRAQDPAALETRQMAGLLESGRSLDLLRKFDRVEISLEGRARALEANISGDAAPLESTLDELSTVQSRLGGVRGAMGGRLLELNDDVSKQKRRTSPDPEAETPLERAIRGGEDAEDEGGGRPASRS